MAAGVARRDRLARRAEAAVVDHAVVRREEVEEALVVARHDAEQRQHRAVVAAGVGEPLSYELAYVVARDVTLDELLVDVFPEVGFARGERAIEVVGDFVLALNARRRRFLRAHAANGVRQVLRADLILAGE